MVACPPFDMSGNLYAHMSATGEALPVTFQNLRTTPSVTRLERERGRNKNDINSGHFVRPVKPNGSACNDLVLE